MLQTDAVVLRAVRGTATSGDLAPQRAFTVCSKQGSTRHCCKLELVRQIDDECVGQLGTSESSKGAGGGRLRIYASLVSYTPLAIVLSSAERV